MIIWMLNKLIFLILKKFEGDYFERSEWYHV